MENKYKWLRTEQDTHRMIFENNGKEYILTGYFDIVTDFMGEYKQLLQLELISIADDQPQDEIYDLSVGFGEFVGQYGSFFVNIEETLPGDVSVKDFLEANNIAFDMHAGFKHTEFGDFPAYRISPFVMEALFPLNEIRDYKLCFDFMGEHDPQDEVDTEWVQESLNAEKASFTEFLEQRQEDTDNRDLL